MNKSANKEISEETQTEKASERETEFFNSLREEINRQLEFYPLTPRLNEYAVYRFGLKGEMPHTAKGTAEKFSLPIERIRTLDRTVLRRLKIHYPLRRRSKAVLPDEE